MAATFLISLPFEIMSSSRLAPASGTSAGLDLLDFINGNRDALAKLNLDNDTTLGTSNNVANGALSSAESLSRELDGRLNLTEQQKRNARLGVFDLPGDEIPVQSSSSGDTTVNAGSSNSDFFDAPTTVGKVEVIRRLSAYVGLYEITATDDPAKALDKGRLEVVANLNQVRFYAWDTSKKVFNSTPVVSEVSCDASWTDFSRFKIEKIQTNPDTNLDVVFSAGLDPTTGDQSPNTLKSSKSTSPSITGQQVIRTLALGYWVGLYKFRSDALSGFGFMIADDGMTYGTLTNESLSAITDKVTITVKGLAVSWSLADDSQVSGTFTRTWDANHQVQSSMFTGTLTKKDKSTAPVNATLVTKEDVKEDEKWLDSDAARWWDWIGAVTGLSPVWLVTLIVGFALMPRKKAKVKEKAAAEKTERDNVKTALETAIQNASSVDNVEALKQATADAIQDLDQKLERALVEVTENQGEGATKIDLKRAVDQVRKEIQADLKSNMPDPSVLEKMYMQLEIHQQLMESQSRALVRIDSATQLARRENEAREREREKARDNEVEMDDMDNRNNRADGDANRDKPGGDADNKDGNVVVDPAEAARLERERLAAETEKERREERERREAEEKAKEKEREKDKSKDKDAEHREHIK